MMDDVTHWPAVAEDGIRWARPEDHNALWVYRASFEALAGAGTGQAVEIGMGGYFNARPLDAQAVDGDLAMHFRGWMRPLSPYTNAIRAADCHLLRLLEPQPDPDHPWTQNATRWHGLPLFFWVEARKPAGEAA